MSQSDTVELPITLSVPTFCKVAFGIGETSSYGVAKRKEIPIMQVGGLVKVPVRVALAKMAAGDPDILRAMTADFAAKLLQIEIEQGVRPASAA